MKNTIFEVKKYHVVGSSGAYYGTYDDYYEWFPLQWCDQRIEALNLPAAVELARMVIMDPSFGESEAYIHRVIYRTLVYADRGGVEYAYESAAAGPRIGVVSADLIYKEDRSYDER